MKTRKRLFLFVLAFALLMFFQNKVFASSSEISDVEIFINDLTEYFTTASSERLVSDMILENSYVSDNANYTINKERNAFHSGLAYGTVYNFINILYSDNNLSLKNYYYCFQIKPNEGYSLARDWKATINGKNAYIYKNRAYIEAPVVKEAEYAMNISGATGSVAHSFGSVLPGYDSIGKSGWGIRNIGKKTLNNISVSITGDSFELDTSNITDSLEPNGYVTFYIKPKDGLPSGNYSEKFTITADNINPIQGNVLFTVVKLIENVEIYVPDFSDMFYTDIIESEITHNLRFGVSVPANANYIYTDNNEIYAPITQLVYLDSNNNFQPDISRPNLLNDNLSIERDYYYRIHIESSNGYGFSPNCKATVNGEEAEMERRDYIL